MLTLDTLKEIKKIDDLAYFLIIMKTAEPDFILTDKNFSVTKLSNNTYKLKYEDELGSISRIVESDIEAYNFINEKENPRNESN